MGLVGFFWQTMLSPGFQLHKRDYDKDENKKTPNSYKCKRCIEKELKFTCQRTYSILQVALYFQCFSLIDPLTHLCSTLNNVLTNQNYIFLTIIQSPAFVSHLQASSSMLAKSAFWTTCVVKQEQDLSTFFFFPWERKCSGSMSRSCVKQDKEDTTLKYTHLVIELISF